MYITLRVSYIEVDDTPDVPIISYKAALDFLEGLRLKIPMLIHRNVSS